MSGALDRVRAAAAAALFGLCLAHPAAGANVALYNFEGNFDDTSGFGTALHMTPTVNGTAPTIVNETAPWINTNLFGSQSLQINSGSSFAFATPGTDLKLELNTFTVQAWVKPATNAANGYIFTYVPRGAGGDGRGYLFGLAGGRVIFQWGNTTDGNSFKSQTGSTVLQSGVWYHVAASFEYPFQGNNVNFAGIKMFVNGAVDGAAGSPGGYSTPNNTSLIDYTNSGGGGPNPKAAFINGFHQNNNTAPDTPADIIFPLAAGTLVDRVMIDNQIYGIYSNGAPGIGLDWFNIPEPSAAVLFALSGLLVVTRRRRGGDRERGA